MISLIDLHYLPSLEYFSVFFSSEKIILEKYEQYVKQSYRNRCNINTANGPIKLVIPVTSKHGKALYKDVQIDYSTKWQNNHWRAIQSAYSKAPFFEHYEKGLKNILFNDFTYLFDLNLSLLSFCLQSLHLSIPLTESKSYEKKAQNGVNDLRSVISPKIQYTERTYYNPAPYLQVFGSKFAPNLSFIDLLFCEGPNAIQILNSSTRGYLNK